MLKQLFCKKAEVAVDNIKYTKISHLLSDVTYYHNKSSYGATLAFQEIESWRQASHSVEYEATMMKKRRALFMPSSSMWQVSAKVTLTDSNRSPSKLVLFDNLTEPESVHFLRLLQSESGRMLKFNQAYFGDEFLSLDGVPELVSYCKVKNGNNSEEIEDPFFLKAKEVRNSESFFYPPAMMTEQVITITTSEEFNQMHEDEDSDMEVEPYVPKETMDFDRLIYKLPDDVISQMAVTLKSVERPVQALAFLYRGSNEYGLSPLFDAHKNIPVQTYGEETYELLLLEAEAKGIVTIAQTTNPKVAYQFLENFDQGCFQHYLKKVPQHALIKDTYDYHYTNFKPMLDRLDQLNMLDPKNRKLNLS